MKKKHVNVCFVIRVCLFLLFMFVLIDITTIGVLEEFRKKGLAKILLQV